MSATMTPEDDAPREDWTLDRLGQYVQRVAKRTARDAWLLGRAYTIAKARAKAEGKRIEGWRKHWIPDLSQPTLSRYEAVGALAEEAVTGKGLTEVYRLLGLTPQKPAPASRAGAPAGVSTPPAPGERADLRVVPPAEPETLLKRLALVVNLLSSVQTDLPSLDLTDDPTPALDDALKLLETIRSVAKRGVAA